MTDSFTSLGERKRGTNDTHQSNGPETYETLVEKIRSIENRLHELSKGKAHKADSAVPTSNEEEDALEAYMQDIKQTISQEAARKVETEMSQLNLVWKFVLAFLIFY